MSQIASPLLLRIVSSSAMVVLSTGEGVVGGNSVVRGRTRGLVRVERNVGG